ncbi:hypothetical protein SAMN04488005_1485 [Yoonia tamlensis]|uniref:Uncharacterized protein n=1 Tax=Yoonia tamlensis TaxID=390270 RepID=A0A1I6GDS9_9RHOB|nr:hypothetical protein SAMN04488005_1485 [Yoonia tamlensis]
MLVRRLMALFPESELDSIDSSDPAQVERLIQKIEKKSNAAFECGNISDYKKISLSLYLLYGLRHDLHEQVTCTRH